MLRIPHFIWVTITSLSDLHPIFIIVKWMDLYRSYKTTLPVKNMYIKVDVKFIPNKIRLLSLYCFHKLFGVFGLYLKTKMFN